MATEVLRDIHGKLIGEIREIGNGKTLYDSHGKALGTFRNGNTYDIHGRLIGSGNLLVTLLNK